MNGYSVQIVFKNKIKQGSSFKLFFINLGYKPNELEEFHYKIVIAAVSKMEAANMAKKTAFFHHTGFKGATAHIDDKINME